MKVVSFNNETERKGINIHRPCSRIFVMVKPLGSHESVNCPIPSIRVRMENSESGESAELVPTVKMDVLGEINSFAEGFFLEPAPLAPLGGAAGKFAGYALYSVILNVNSSVSLGANKFISVDLTELARTCEYQLFTLELPALSNDFVKIDRYTMAVGEAKKHFNIENYEVLAIPIDRIDEVQFYTPTSTIQPIYNSIELKALQLLKNDIVSVSSNILEVGMQPDGETILHHDVVYFGYKKYAIVDVTGYSSVDVRLSDTSQSFEMFAIDTVKK